MGRLHPAGTGIFLSLLTGKTALVVKQVYGAGKMQCAAYFALRGHYVYYASRENTTITAMATFVNRILPRAEDEANQSCCHPAPIRATVAFLR